MYSYSPQGDSLKSTNDNAMTNLFTYGSLMCSDIMFKVTGYQAASTQATLSNYYRSRIRHREYPGIVQQQGEQVPGVIYCGLNRQAIDRLDTFEGNMYQRQEVRVTTDILGVVAAMTYVIKPEYRNLLTGKEWSFSRFLAVEKDKFIENYFGFQEL